METGKKYWQWLYFGKRWILKICNVRKAQHLLQEEFVMVEIWKRLANLNLSDKPSYMYIKGGGNWFQERENLEPMMIESADIVSM